MLKNTVNTGKIFERKVAKIFHLLGFKPEIDVLMSGRQIDILLESRDGPLKKQFIVECKDQAKPVGVSQYDSFHSKLSAIKNQYSPKISGIIVSSVGFTKEAKTQSEFYDITLLTISELETQVIDFSGYVTTLKNQLLNDTNLKYYIHPEIKKEHSTIENDANNVIDEWIKNTSLNQMTLLGDYGTGKTTFLKHLSLKYADTYENEVLKHGARGRVPIFIDLKDYTQAINLKQIILDFLDTYSIKYSSYAAFEYVLKEGQVLLILDGFDEMASRGNYKITLANFKALNRYAQGRAKIILSCRTHYFVTDSEMQSFHGNHSSKESAPKEYTDLYQEIATRRNFLITYLMEFNQKQVEKYIEKRCANEYHNVLNFIDKTYNLNELSKKPVLLDMIVQSYDNLPSETNEITPGILYMVYTDIWLSNNDWSTVIDVETKKILLERIAYQTSTDQNRKIHYKEIPELIKQWNGNLNDIDSKEIEREIRTASFLIRNSSEEYQFSHKSFQEFFYAKFLLTEARNNKLTGWSYKFLHREIYTFVRDLISSFKNQYSRSILNLINSIEKPEVDVYAKANAIKVLGILKSNQIKEKLVHILKRETNSILLCCAATGLKNYPEDEVIELLILTYRKAKFRAVRTNALISLCFINDHKKVQFNAIENFKELFLQTNKEFLFRHVKNIEDKEVIEMFIKNCPQKANNKETLISALEFCGTNYCLESDKYCERMLFSTKKPTVAIKAFSCLSSNKKIIHINQIYKIIDIAIQSRSNGTFTSALGCLKELPLKDVENFLDEKLSVVKQYYREQIINELYKAFPNLFCKKAKMLLSCHNLSYKTKLILLKSYLIHTPTDGVDIAKQFLIPKARVVLKIGILKLIEKTYPDKLAEIILSFWETEPATVLKRYSLELLHKIDSTLSLELMLNSGIQNNYRGTRIAVCTVLGTISTDEVTDVLTTVLKNDDDKYVRMTALRSLCSPGRKIQLSKIKSALSNESDPKVKSLTKKLIG